MTNASQQQRKKLLRVWHGPEQNSRNGRPCLPPNPCSLVPPPLPLGQIGELHTIVGLPDCPLVVLQANVRLQGSRRLDHHTAAHGRHQPVSLPDRRAGGFHGLRGFVSLDDVKLLIAQHFHAPAGLGVKVLLLNERGSDRQVDQILELTIYGDRKSTRL